MNTITILTYSGRLNNHTNVISVYTHRDKFDNQKVYVETVDEEFDYDPNDIKEYVIS